MSSDGAWANGTWNFSQKSSDPFAKGSEKVPMALYGREPCQTFALGERHYLLRLVRSGEEAVLDAGAHQVLSLCEGFHTLDEHARKISIRISGGDAVQARLKGLLSSFSAQGLLLPAKQLLAELTIPEGVPWTGLQPLRTRVIRTCDRPEALDRLLHGLAKLKSHEGIRYRTIVIDDSRSQESQHRNRALTFGHADSEDLAVRYHGPQEQAALVGELMAAYPESADTVRWLLAPGVRHGRPTPGRSLNHALLLTAGERVILLDDDSRLEPRPAPEQEAGLAIGAVPQSCQFFSGREEISRLPKAVDFDPFAAHGQILGLTLGEALARFPEALDEQSLARLDLAEGAYLSSASPVLVSVNGVFGDPGSGRSQWLYELEDDRLHRQMVASPEAYRAFTTQRHLWRGHRKTSFLLDYALMLTAGVGLDNSRPLAPTLPEGRNEDLVLGDAVKYLYPDSVAVALPWGMTHFPEPERLWDPAGLDLPIRPGIPGFLASLARVSGGLCPAQRVNRRAAFLAESYRALSDASESELRNRVVQEALAERTARVARMQANLAHRGSYAPDYWVADVQRAIAANTRSLQARGEPWQLEIGLGQAIAPKAAESYLREVLCNYADALQLWPLLWDTAARMPWPQTG
jgi:hypothetical protein